METGDINSVIHLTESIGDGTIATELCASGYYSVILHENTIYGRAYGWQTCDYMGGTLVCLVPQTTGALQLSCSAIAATRLIAFHPDIFHGTFLGKEMTDYSFFSYRTNEALHLSVREKQIIGDCMDAIENEIKEPLDRYSTNVVSKRIGLLLDYCMRFYERQLTTRYLTVQTTLKQYETMVRDFISTRR